jgi:hypothetical protein
MTHDARRPGEVEPRPVVDAAHLSKAASTAQATTLLVFKVQGRGRPGAVPNTPAAALEIVQRCRRGVIHVSAARDLTEATTWVRQFGDYDRTIDGHTAAGTAPLPAGGTAPLPSDVTRTGGTAA